MTVMSKINISLTPSWKLELKLTKIKGVKAEPLIPTLRELRRLRRGSKMSYFFRHIFSHSKIKKIMGTNLAVLAIASAYLPQQTYANIEPEVSVIEVNEPEFDTDLSVKNPVNTIKITQNYSFFHPGIDFDGVTGEPIYAIMKGVVVQAEYSRLGYGNNVLIDHGGGLMSLYAHLSKIYVQPGQEINEAGQVIGEMGATGRAFGGHLHFEVHDHGRAINPLSILPIN
jgi:murein DD-endopeptidase MepM/ murein hydrolase activator NlpD